MRTREVNMKKIISFFLASSINDMPLDRLEVGDFINQLNCIYESKNIFIRLYKCESNSLSHAIKKGGSQEALDEIIRNSDLCFVIFWKTVGEYTHHELEVALKAFADNNRPKVIVYFKKLLPGETVPEDISKIMKIIDEELLHYHREYDHIDTLKLGIITQLQVNGFIDADLSVQDGSIVSGNQSIIPIKDIPLFSDNNYISLLTRHAELKKKRDKLKEEYEKNPSDLRLYRELSGCTKECNRAKEDLDEVAENILDMNMQIASFASNGKNLSENLRIAIKLFDEGDYDGVLDHLSPEDLDNGFKRLNDLEKDIDRARLGLIEEYKLRILALKAKARWAEVYESYEKVVAQITDRPEIPKTVVYEYAVFLFEQKKYSKCVETGEKLEAILTDKYADANPEVVASLHNLLGKACYCDKNFSKALIYLNKALEERRSLPETCKNKHSMIAESCYDLARLYYAITDYSGAEELFKTALVLFDTNDDSADVRFKKALASEELALLYYQTNKHELAAEMYAEALEIFSVLAASSPEKYNEYVADVSRRLAGLFCAVIRHRKTDRYFIPSLQTKNFLIEKGGNAFADYASDVCDLLLRLSGDCDNPTEKFVCEKSFLQNALKDYSDYDKTDFISDMYFYSKPFDMSYIGRLCEKSLSVYEDLAKLNPEAYEGNVAEVLNLTGEFCTLTEKYDQAFKAFESAEKLLTKFIDQKNGYADIALASTMCNKAYLFLQTGKSEAIEYYSKAIRTYEDFNNKNRGAFDNEIARTLCSLGNVYAKMSDRNNALNCYSESIRLYLKLYAKSPKAFIDRVINTVGNIVHLLCPENEHQEMSRILKSV